MITTKNLHIGYKNALLRVDDLHLNAGVYILIGKNGSGKSTFLKTISGALSPISGMIALDNTPLSQFSHAEVPKQIAFVQTQFPQVDFLSVSEYLALGRSPHTSFFGKLSTKDHEQVQLALEAMHILHLKDRFTNELSDGERQMVAIARTFAQETKVIALDEPTAFLDYKNKGEILRKLLELGRTHEKCIVLSSHDIDQSIDSGADFLVVNSKEKRISHLPAGTKKLLLLQESFNQNT